MISEENCNALFVTSKAWMESKQTIDASFSSMTLKISECVLSLVTRKSLMVTHLGSAFKQGGLNQPFSISRNSREGELDEVKPLLNLFSGTESIVP